MRGVRLSRWSMSYFTIAIVSLMLAELVWLSGLGQPLRNIGAAWVLVGVHLTTIGFLTILMLGALSQFIPVLTETELASQTLSGITLFCVASGLTGMILGFLSLPTIPGGILGSIPWLLPTGGALVVTGVIVALVNIGITLRRAWPWQLPAWLAATGLLFLAVTVSVGLMLALSLSFPATYSPTQLMVIAGRGLASHVIGGVLGWLTLTAMGVTYKLLAMFTLSDENRGIWGWIAYISTASGIATAWLARWLDRALLTHIGWAFILVGLAIYLVDMRLLYSQRKRKHLELNAKFGVVPLGFLGIIIIAAVFVHPATSLSRLDIALTFFGLYGWLGGLAVTQLYKIVPFLTWLHVFGRRLGKGPSPRVQDLVDEKRDQYAYYAYYAAALTGGISLYEAWTIVFRVAMAVALVATMDIARALYHAAHPNNGPWQVKPKPAAAAPSPPVKQEKAR